MTKREKIRVLKLWLFVLYVTLRDFSFSVWHFQCEVAVITCGKQILSANMVVMSDLVIVFCEPLTALSTCCRVVVVCLLYSCQRRHVLTIRKYTGYYFTFLHYMFVKCIHHARSVVLNGLRLIFCILANSMTRKPTHTVFIGKIGRFFSVYLFVEGVRKDSKSQIR